MEFKDLFNDTNARAGSGKPITYDEYRDACLNKEAWEDVARRMGWEDEWTAEDEHFVKTVLPTLGL